MIVELLALLSGCTRAPPEDTAAVPTADTGRRPIDADGDGFTDDLDCNDAAPSIFPGAPGTVESVCRGFDINCDGLPDGDEDFDGDAVTHCQLDCDDHDPARYPGAPDAMDDVDTNCDGTDGVGEVATRLALGQQTNYGLGSSLRAGDLDGDGCEDLLVSESGLTHTGMPWGFGASDGWLHGWMGCATPTPVRSWVDTTFGSSGTGQTLFTWSNGTHDLAVSCSNQGTFDESGGVEIVDFSVDPPELVEELEGGGPLQNVHTCAVVTRGSSELVLTHLNQFSSGPMAAFTLPIAPGPTIDAPDRQWWAFEQGRHTGWTMLGFDRTGDGQDELVTCTTAPTPLEAQAGQLLVIEEPDLAREVWHGDLALGTGFGILMYPAAGLPGAADTSLLAGGAAMGGTGRLYVLPPVDPGDHTLEEVALELRGEFDGEWFGAGAAVGDVNGDGLPDIVVGAPWDLNQTDRRTGPPGKVYVFLGPFTQPVLTRADARVFVGQGPDEAFGWSVELADLNGDGLDEIYVGAPAAGHIHPAYLNDGAVYRIDL